MKKTLLSILSIAAFSAASFAQCTPDVAFAGQALGFYPDAGTFITNSSTTYGAEYNAVLTLTMVVDYSITSPIQATAKVDAFQLVSVTGGPTGFTFTEGGAVFNPSVTAWENTYGTPGDNSTLMPEQGCVSIYGSIADVNAAAPLTGFTDYPLTFTMDARIVESTPSLGGPGAYPVWASTLGQSLEYTSHAIRVNADGTVGIINQQDKTGVSVSPNPSNGVFQLVFNNLEQNASASVYDLQGREVWSNVLTSSTGIESIDLAGFTAGMYTLSVRTDSKSISKKLILQ